MCKCWVFYISWLRNYKTTEKKNKKSSEEKQEEEQNKDKEVGGIKLLSKSKTFLDPEEPKEKKIKQTKPDLLAHRKVRN